MSPLEALLSLACGAIIAAAVIIVRKDLTGRD
jgi:hypothetical protein